MRVRTSPTIILCLFALTPYAKGGECGGRVFQIDDLKKVTDFYPLYVQNRRGVNYGVIGNCAELFAGAFSGPITFFVRNRFRNYRTIPVGILRIKSVRTFAKAIGPRIKVSRHSGWYVPNGADPTVVVQSGELSDIELRLTPSQWTNEHANSDDVAALNKKLGAAWHAYALPDKSLPSTDTRGYWSFSSEGDVKYQTLTNYLIRFNTAQDGENIEFYTETPLGVQRIDLSIDSNFDLIAGDYTFYIAAR